MPHCHFVTRALGLFTLACAATFAAHAEPTMTTLAGRQVEVSITRPSDARATLVFENGSRETLDTWDEVARRLHGSVATFAYNRPGLGRSDASATPRDGRTIVAELRELLRAQGLPPPYVLVGHSLGGLYQQLFAREHPDEVRGLVLVDTLYPGVIKRPEEFPFTTRVAKWLLVHGAVAAEIDRIHDTGDEVLAAPSPDRMPIVQLINVPKSRTAVGVDFGVVNDDAATIAAVHAMYPAGRKRIVDSDHRIQTANPEFVVQAIDDVLACGATDTPGSATCLTRK